ncbi:MAG: DUF481 domain-containing protein [Chitinophagaceae bacterium]|nr:MAG: DUF481 domain-containing protein [Chitinophagaceae bacterium]
MKLLFLLDTMTGNIFPRSSKSNLVKHPVNMPRPVPAKMRCLLSLPHKTGPAMMKTLFLFCILLVSSFWVNAQGGDTTRYKFRYGLTGIYNRTNDVRSFVINNALALSVVRRKFALNSNSSWIFGRQESDLSNNDISSALNFDVLKDLQRLYYWGLANFTSSYSLKVNYQFQGGVGLGYNISNTDRLELVVSDGILFEASDLDLDTGKETYQTIRNSLRLKHRVRLSNVVSLEGSHFWQPSFSNSKDYIIRSTTGLSLKLKSWLSVTGAVTYNKYSRTDRENLLVNFGFVAENVFVGRSRPATTAVPVAPVIPVE